ncbi:MAG: EamA family transporter, partial [Lachnospiraceae bacterium]|nr:EamA family transporter [Lachnospiraceae bacterium]
MKKYLGIMGLIIVAIVWGGGFVASDMALDSYSPFQIMTIRFFVATVMMVIMSWKHIRTITKKEIKAGCLLG